MNIFKNYHAQVIDWKVMASKRWLYESYDTDVFSLFLLGQDKFFYDVVNVTFE